MLFIICIFPIYVISPITTRKFKLECNCVRKKRLLFLVYLQDPTAIMLTAVRLKSYAKRSDKVAKDGKDDSDEWERQREREGEMLGLKVLLSFNVFSDQRSTFSGESCRCPNAIMAVVSR